MELRKLRHFVVLAEELHFGRAADRLAITQPPLSLSIRSLEDELGIRLFERTRRKVALTHAGTAFLKEARNLLERATHAVELARAADRGESGRLAVGFMAASAYTLLPSILRDFAAQFPAVYLDLRELTLPQQFEALRRGDIHVGLVRPPVTDAELAAENLLEESLVVALPSRHRLLARSRISIKQLHDELFVMFQRSPGLVLHDIVMRFCLEKGFTPRIAQEASQTHVVVGLVSGGIGIALVPESAQNIRMRGVTYRPLIEHTLPVHSAIAWRRADKSPVVSAFINTARQAAHRYQAAIRQKRAPAR
jgi:DNA-binding transcriptional LysR family regulator